ncbi:MAG: ParB/RepB/Spo0J family partition protein [candidate division KSB1 bacterium]|nr:ParB/RepB/Spo0J family partition protein [candidate division KSB1 bacterium]
MVSSKRRTALGKGLAALLPDIGPEDSDRLDKLAEVEIELVEPNPFQPRSHFDPEALEELKRSIAEKGVIQPITVRRRDGGYQLIAGERRLRAAKSLGLERIPAYVLDVESDEEMLELSIIENIHREDLNPMELARGYQRLIEQCHLTQEEVARRVGKDRTTITNFLRLLKLPRPIQESLERGELSMGHARALINLEDERLQLAIWRRAVKENLSVRRVEELVRQAAQRPAVRPSEPARSLPPEIAEAENRLRRVLATQVRIHPGKRGGRIEIEYYSAQDLTRIVQLIEEGAAA